MLMRIRSSHLVIVATILVGCQSPPPATVTQFPMPSTEQQNILRDVSHWHETHSINNLPSEILRLCAPGGHGMANPGERYNSSDLTSPSLPNERLIWFAVNGNYYLVHYETGGFFPQKACLLAEFTSQRTHILWQEYNSTPFADYKMFLDSLNGSSSPENSLHHL